MWIDREQSPIILERGVFDAVGHSHYKRPSVITRAWNDCSEAAKFSIPMTREEHLDCNQDRLSAVTLNFSELIHTMRSMERGESYLLLGKTAWDIVSDINNQDIRVNDPEYLVPWVDFIHRDFRNGQLRRERSAEMLRTTYEQLASCAVAPYVELTI